MQYRTAWFLLEWILDMYLLLISILSRMLSNIQVCLEIKSQPLGLFQYQYFDSHFAFSVEPCIN